MMRAQVNNLASLLRVPVYNLGKSQITFSSNGRNLHSNTPNVCAVQVAPAQAVEPRPPLTDLLGRRHDYLRISLTERCNLRCQYCMPAEGVALSPQPSLLSRAELARAVRSFAALGVRKVRLTGGEPTLRPDLADIIYDISSVPGIESVAMTTNGLVLTRRLPALQRAGLAAVNISLDSLRARRYELMARRPGLKKVLAGIDLALQLDYRPVKINVVLMKGFNDDEICDFVEYTRDRNVEVRFIEFMPFSGNAWDDSKLVPHKEAVRALLQRFPEALPCLPRPNDTARVWQVPGFAGKVGFISSMTKNFCSTCNRLRLTADGNLKVCLFGAAEVSLRDALRQGATEEQLEDMIRTALRNKKPQHAAPRSPVDLRAASALLVPPVSSRDGYKDISTHTTGILTKTTSGTSTKVTDFSSKTPDLQIKSTELPIKTTEISRKTTKLPIKTTELPLKMTKLQIKTTRLSIKTTRSPSSMIIISTQLATPTAFPAFLVPPNTSWTSARAFSYLSRRLTESIVSCRCASSYSDSDPSFSHLDASGKARMVDVGEKQVTTRVAEAQCSLKVGGRLLRLLKDARLPKGDALTVAQIAGVIGAKKTAELIPMCHPLPLDCVRIQIHLPKGENLDGGDITIRCEVRCTAKTGAEMEALTGAAIATLALYDMCKSVDKHMTLTNLRVVRKSGGRSGNWPQEDDSGVKVRKHDTSPIKPDEAYVPTNMAHF